MKSVARKSAPWLACGLALGVTWCGTGSLWAEGTLGEGGSSSGETRDAAAAGSDDSPDWCAPETITLADGVCAVVSPARPPQGEGTTAKEEAAAPHSRVLVIFLHSLVGKGTKWQWQQHRVFVRLAEKYGVTVLMPRGRLGIGPGRAPDVWAWPTAQATQESREAELIAEWLRYKQELEQHYGRYERSYVFGFSNGAYYGSSLALRGALAAGGLDVDGYAVFAGGSGSKYQRLLARHTKHRSPIFVGYGTQDPARGGQRALIDLLGDLDWPHAHAAANVGHTVTQSQLDRALRFLTEASAPVPEAAALEADEAP